MEDMKMNDELELLQEENTMFEEQLDEAIVEIYRLEAEIRSIEGK